MSFESGRINHNQLTLLFFERSSFLQFTHHEHQQNTNVQQIILIFVPVFKRKRFNLNFTIFFTFLLISFNMKILVLFLLSKRICNGFHAINGTNQHNSCTPTHNNTKLTGLISYFIRIFSI